MTSPLTFNFVTHSVRVVMREDEPWFVAVDVCRVLEYVNVPQAVGKLDDDEKGIYSIDTLGGQQEMLIINESGLYSLILTSRKPEAKKFKKWVTSEVLPAIRKTGRYEAPAPIPVRKPIRSRADLSFTALDAQGRLQNWVVPHVPHVPHDNWHQGVAVGKAYFAEVLELAKHHRQDAFWALQTALVDGAATQWPSGGWGIECGFAEAIATALFPPEPPRLTRHKDL